MLCCAGAAHTITQSLTQLTLHVCTGQSDPTLGGRTGQQEALSDRTRYKGLVRKHRQGCVEYLTVDTDCRPLNDKKTWLECTHTCWHNWLGTTAPPPYCARCTCSCCVLPVWAGHVNVVVVHPCCVFNWYPALNWRTILAAAGGRRYAGWVISSGWPAAVFCCFACQQEAVHWVNCQFL